VADVWDAPKRDAVRHAFMATGKTHAAEMFATVARMMDEHLQRWVSAYTDACEETHVRGDQSEEVLDLRMMCLNDNLDATRALTRVLGKADATVVDNAIAATGALDDLVRCGDVRQLRTSVPSSRESVSSEAATALRSKLRDARALLDAGAYDASLAVIDPVISESEHLAYRSMLAEALTVKGLDLVQLDQPRGGDVLERAAFVAEESGHDRVFAEAAALLIFVRRVSDPQAAERWASLADAALQRTGRDFRLDSWRLNNLAALRYCQGRMEDAHDAIERSVALKMRAFGSQHLDVALGENNAAIDLLAVGRPADALATIQRALVILERWLPADHFRVVDAKVVLADVLTSLGRYDEADAIYRLALQILTSEPMQSNARLAEPLNGLGRVALKRRDFPAAREALESAVRACEGDPCQPATAAEARFGLARVLAEPHGDPLRARALALQALRYYAPVPYFASQRREIEAWLTSHTASPSPGPRRHAARQPRPPA
jgi:tetratricopeptide (TPR) repeat protein